MKMNNQQTPSTQAAMKRPRNSSLVRFNSLTKVTTYSQQQHLDEQQDTTTTACSTSTWYTEQEMISFRYQAREELYRNNPQRVRLTKEKQLYKRLTIKTVVDAYKRYNNNAGMNKNNSVDEIVASIYQKCTHYFVTVAQAQALHDEYDCNNEEEESLLLVDTAVMMPPPPKFPFPYKRKSSSSTSTSTSTSASSSPKRSYNMENGQQQESPNNKRRRLVVVAAMAC